MKSIEQILDESAIQAGYKSIDEAYFDSETQYLHPIIKRAMIEHSKQCCDEQIKACGNEVKQNSMNMPLTKNIKTSVLNAPNVVTTNTK